MNVSQLSAVTFVQLGSFVCICRRKHGNTLLKPLNLAFISTINI